MYSLGLNLGIKTVWILLVEVAVQRALGTEAYGAYFAAFNFTMLPAMLLDLGITQFNTRNIAQHQQLVRKHFSGIFLLKLILGMLYAVITLSIGYVSGFRTEAFGWLVLLGAVQFFTSLNQYIRSNFAALLLFKWDAFLGVLDRLILLVSIGSVLWLLHSGLSVWMYIGLQVAAVGTVSITGFIVLQMHIGKLGAWKIRRAFLWALLKQTFPFALLTLFMTGYLRMDAVILKNMHSSGLHEAGVYAAAFRLFDAFSQVPILLCGILLPVLSRLWISKANPSGMMNIAFLLLMTFTCLLGGAGYFYGDWIARILYTEDVEAIQEVLRIYLLALIPYGAALLSGTLLTAAHRMRELNGIALACLLFNLTLNFLLVPEYGAWGSAVTALLTVSLSAILQFAFAFRYTDFRFSTSGISRLLLFITGLSGTGYVLSLSDFSLSSQCVTYFIFALLWAFITRVFDVKGLWQLLKEKADKYN